MQRLVKMRPRSNPQKRQFYHEVRNLNCSAEDAALVADIGRHQVESKSRVICSHATYTKGFSEYVRGDILDATLRSGDITLVDSSEHIGPFCFESY